MPRVPPLALAVSVVLTMPAFAQDRPQRLTLDGAGSIELTAAWDDFVESVYGLFEEYPQLQGFRPARERATYATADFAAFLPDEPVSVGDTWRVDADAALPFLRQLHEGATTRMHHGFGAGPGAWACLRAIGPETAEIVLRVHAEFVLVEGEGLGDTSWLTPSQFAGRLVVDRTAGTVRSFRLQVPPRNSNVDVNVPQRPRPDVPDDVVVFGVADIGFIPRMEVAGEADADRDEPRYVTTIGVEDATQRLARRFYAFAEIGWLDVPAALARAQTEGIPLHIVALFGALDDESC